MRASKLHAEKREDRYKALPLEIRDEFFTKLFEHDILGPICMCQCFAGLRIGEVLALRWKCLDFEHNEIRIDSAITQDVVFDKDDNILQRRTIISDTKTESSQRIVPMTNILKEALLRWKKDRWALQRQTGIEVLGDECIVFTNNQGKMRTYHGTKCILRRFVEKYGWEKYNIHFHMLRHTFSAMLFEARENPRVIQMLLGHASINTTMQTYNSVDRSYFKEATDNLDKKYGNKILDEYK